MPERSKGRSQKKFNLLSFWLRVGSGVTDPFPQKYSIMKPAGTCGGAQEPRRFAASVKKKKKMFYIVRVFTRRERHIESVFFFVKSMKEKSYSF
jgi:hypothetical protein